MWDSFAFSSRASNDLGVNSLQNVFPDMNGQGFAKEYSGTL